MRAWPLFCLCILTLAGCTLPAGTEREYVHSSPPQELGSGMGGSFVRGEPFAVMVFFNLTSEGEGTYRFQIGDRGSATGCFLSQEGLADWLEVHFASEMRGEYRPSRTYGCAIGAATADARVALAPESYAFVLVPDDCPHMDCSYHLSLDLPDVTSNSYVGRIHLRVAPAP